ncbi:MAG: hypothetical protein ABIO44_01825 [Saprospiraceae bacterium]
MKIILDQIEFMLPEAIFKMVSNSHISGRIKKANEVNKNIWNYQIKFEDSIIECELKYGRNQVSKIICGCGRSNVKHPCLHAWIAAYWHYKEIVQLIKVQNEQETKTKKSNPDFDNLNSTELIQFIQLSLKIDRNLNKWSEILLKKKLQDEPHYDFLMVKMKIFDAPFSPKANTSPLKQYKDQTELIGILYEQAVQEFIDGHLEEAFFKSLACIIKSDEWLTLYQQNNHVKLLKLYLNLHKAIEQIYKSIKSPELLDKLFIFTTDILENTSYAIRNKTENLYSIFFNYSINKNNKNKILSLITQKIESNSFFTNNEIEPLMFLINNLSLNEFKLELKKNLAICITTQTWLMLLESLKENDIIEHFEEHLNSIYKEVSKKEVKLRTAEYILQTLIQSNQVEICKKKARDFAINLSHIPFAKIFFDCIDIKTREAELFIKDYKILNKNKNPEFIFELLKEINIPELLLTEIKECTSIDLIMKFDISIFKEYKFELVEVYKKLSKEFLLTHVGHQAFNYIDNIKKHISIYGNKSLAEKFLIDIQTLYPERTKLINQS